MKVTGACHCGAIRYEAEVDPPTAVLCHCTDCQVLSGTAFRTTVRTVEGTFRLLSGTPRVYTRVADSGNRREQGFCERCGTPIYATSPGPEPKMYGLRVGSIDQRAQLAPAAQIWARSRLPWARDLSVLPASEKQ